MSAVIPAIENATVCTLVSLYTTCLDFAFQYLHIFLYCEIICTHAFPIHCSDNRLVFSIWMSWSFNSYMDATLNLPSVGKKRVMVKKVHSTTIWDCLNFFSNYLFLIGILFQNIRDFLISWLILIYDLELSFVLYVLYTVSNFLGMCVCVCTLSPV